MNHQDPFGNGVLGSGPGLDMSHGFLHYVVKHQMKRAENDRLLEMQRHQMSLQAMSQYRSPRPLLLPTVPIYRPPVFGTRQQIFLGRGVPECRYLFCPPVPQVNWIPPDRTLELSKENDNNYGNYCERPGGEHAAGDQNLNCQLKNLSAVADELSNVQADALITKLNPSRRLSDKEILTTNEVSKRGGKYRKKSIPKLDFGNKQLANIQQLLLRQQSTTGSKWEKKLKNGSEQELADTKWIMSEENKAAKEEVSVNKVMEKGEVLQWRETGSSKVECSLTHDVETLPRNIYDDYVAVCEQEGISIEEIDLMKYIAKAQVYIAAAICDPSNLTASHKKEVARTIVNRGWEDPGYHKTAAAICRLICIKEKEHESLMSIPMYHFRRTVGEVCEELMADAEALREYSVPCWRGFVGFTHQAYKQLNIDSVHLRAQSLVLYSVLEMITKTQLIHCLQEVELLSAILHDCGAELEFDNADRMRHLMSALRDIFLDPNTQQDIHIILLPLLELYATKWNLSNKAKQAYLKKGNFLD